MNSPAAPRAPAAARPGASGAAGAPTPRDVAAFAAGLWHREPRLVAFAAVLLAAMLPAALMLGLDDRTLRGVNVWVKPMKFMASIALLALTTAWFAAHLSEAARRSRAFGALVWTLIATGGFEVAYITLQAALGAGSHYNVGDAFHATMYTLMGVGALVLTATQPWLAWLLWRHGDRSIAPAYRIAVQIGLVLTFVLGAGVGMLLSGQQPPTGPGLPVVGWSTVAGDLRVAHFVGIHAGQVIPILGFALAAWRLRGAVAGVWIVAAAWTALWAATLAQALAGRPLLAL
ncbi:MAG: hypothetical protein MUC74_12885 [Ideonella sp.]|jgi:hypothetical protein|nr:hypothetical protein [Ideonella sp.]